MQTGSDALTPVSSALRTRPRRAQAQRGFTYMILLALLALLGASLAALGTAWTTAAHRERETELRFRGEQIQDAIRRYRAAVAPPTWPSTLDDLLEDRRGPEVRHHLRRLWTDPFTGRTDWVLIDAAATEGGGLDRRIKGVRSRSSTRRLATAGTEAVIPDEPRVSDWVFVSAAASAPGPGASAPKRSGS